MKKLLLLILIVLIGIIVYSFLINPGLFLANIIKTLEIWLYKVYPSIFTFYLLASLLINTRLIDKIIYWLRPLFKPLKFSNENALHLFLLSIFVGNPTSASLICEALNQDRITAREANVLLKGSSFLNPFFIISFLTGFTLKYSFLIIGAHIISNFLIIFGLNRHKAATSFPNPTLRFSFAEFLNAINKVIALLLMISGIMCFCNILKYSLITVISIIGDPPLFIEIIFANFEVALGLHNVLSFNLSLLPTLMLIAFICSFAGISIHLQVLNVIGNEKLSYSGFFKYRLLQALLCVIIVLLLYPLI